MKKFKIGFVGVGFFSQVAYLKNLIKRKDTELTAIAEAKPKLRLSIKKKKYQIKNIFPTHLDLIKSKIKLDIIFVITARKFMPLIVNDCLKSNFNVFSEKPMASNSFQAKKLLVLRKKSRSMYFSGYMRRFDKGVVKAKKRLFKKKIRDKSFGNLISVSVKGYDANPYCNENDYIKAEKNIGINLDSWKTFLVG